MFEEHLKVVTDLKERIESLFPGALVVLDRPRFPMGYWFVDIRIADKSHTIEYRPGKGYGLYAEDCVYSEGPSELFGTNEVEDLVLRLIPGHADRTDTEKKVLALAVIRYLNEVLALDPDAIHQLMETRVPCNQALSDHPTTQVGGTVGSPMVGPLGILNGLVGVRDDHWGYITAVYDDTSGKLVRFQPTADVPVPA